MASELHNEKTIRNPEDDESPAVKQEEDFSNNLERGTKPKKDMLLKEAKDINGGTQDCDSSKRIATEEAKPSDYTAPKNTVPLPIYRPGENSTSTFHNNNPSKMAPDQEKDPSSKVKKKGGRSSTDPYPDPSKNVVDSVARTSSPLEKEKKEADPYAAEKNIGVPYSSNEAPGNINTSPATRSYEEKKEKTGSCCPCCSIL